jgi:hypothetical protein
MRTPRSYVLLFLALSLAACGQKSTAEVRSPLETLDAVLAPHAVVAALRKLSGGHFHATAYLRVDTSQKRAPGDATIPASPSAITTTTDVWMDKHGNYRIVESNDQDGGREMVRMGNEVAVALRYGKMLRRSAQDSETARFLAEAAGAPWAAWEIARRQVEVGSTDPGTYRWKLAGHPVDMPAGFSHASVLRKWRETVDLKALDGQATMDVASRALLAFTCKTTFLALRDDVPIEGEMTVTAALDEIGKSADIVMPATDISHPRQRTVLEERALLGDLGASLSSNLKKTRP